jgi:polysaccharide export outer membrane protein
MKRILAGFVLFLLIAGIGGAQQEPPAQSVGAKPPSPPASPQTDPSAQFNETFVIGLQDVLQVNVWKEPDHSVPQAVVRPDGKITMPLIGDIQAAGFTPKQLGENITERLKTILEIPSVTVIVLRIESRKVSIVGQVAKPGFYPLGAPMTVLDLIAQAGGLTEYAKTKDIKILRKKDGKTLNFNYKDVIKGKNLQQNVYLENGDIVLVP